MEEALTVLVSQFVSPPLREKGLSMYLVMRQGGRTVGRYVDDFSKLARYAMEVTIIMEEVRTTIVAPRMGMVT